MVNSIKKSLKRAFTITELVIVIAVIAILAAVLIPTLSNVVESANKSAALSTCRNALSDLQGIYAEEGKTTEDIDGMAFVSNGYVYVFINSGLQYVGELEDLGGVDNTGKAIKATSQSYKVSYSGTHNSVTYDSAILNIAAGATYSTFTWGSVYTLSSELAAVENKHTAENLYVYSIELNNTTYVGFFTYETGTALYQTESATYSRLYQYSTLTTSGSSELTCFAA